MGSIHGGIMRFFGGIAAAVFLFSPTTFADVKLSGNVPSLELPNLQQKINQIWQHEAETYLLAPKSFAAQQPPEINFYEFDRAKESTEWQAWQNQWILNNPSVWLDWTQINGIPQSQITPEWIAANVTKLFPFPVTFLAFHYDGTNEIQVSPSRTFLRFYQNDGYGVKQETTGYGYYTAAHEMMHYTLAQDGIPDRLHHCLFVSEKNGHTLMGDMADYLISAKIVAPIIRNWGYEAERSMLPCDQLSADDLALVKQYLDTSMVWNH